MAAGDGFVDTNLGELLLNVYSRDTIMRLQNFTAPFLSSLKAAPNYKVGGNGWIFGVEQSGGESFRFQDNQAILPAAAPEIVKQATVNPRFFVGTVQVSGLAKALAPGDPASFADVVSYTLDRRATEMTQHQEGALFRGAQDPLCTVSSLATLTITVSDSVQNLREGMKVDIFNAAGSTLRVSTTITAVDWAANTFDVAAATGVTGTDIVFLAGQQTAGSFADRSYDGLSAGVATTGTYLGLSRTGGSAVDRWKGNVIDALSTPIDEDLLYRARIRVSQESGVGMDAIRGFTVITHENQCRKFAEIAYPRQRFSGTSIDLGVNEITYGGQAIMTSPFCPETDAYALDKGVFNHFATVGGTLQISQDFGPAWRFVPNYDQGMAYLRAYDNFVLRNPRRACRLQNLAAVSSR